MSGSEERTVTYYKFTAENGHPCHGGHGQWPLPTADGPGAWLEVAGELIACANGLHLVTRDNLLAWLGAELWEAELDTERPWFVRENKVVASRARLVRRVDTWTAVSQRLFAADCAERALLREREHGREPDARSWAAVQAARQFASGGITTAARAAARAAAGDAAWDAARDAARAAAWAAALAAARARDAAWAAAGAAARARDAAWAAAGDAAGAAARDAELAWQANRLSLYLWPDRHGAPIPAVTTEPLP